VQDGMHLHIQISTQSSMQQYIPVNLQSIMAARLTTTDPEPWVQWTQSPEPWVQWTQPDSLWQLHGSRQVGGDSDNHHQ